MMERNEPKNARRMALGCLYLGSYNMRGLSSLAPTRIRGIGQAQERRNRRAALTALHAIPSTALYRPRGYWKYVYIEKQGKYPGRLTAAATPSDDEDAEELESLDSRHDEEDGSEATTKTSTSRRTIAEHCVDRTLDTLRPPPSPGLFECDRLRSLLCEGCGLPATTNTIQCRHCNVVVHSWCKEDGISGQRGRGARRMSFIQQRRRQSQKQKGIARWDWKSQKTILIADWVCWECNEDMLLAIQFHRGLKNRQLGAHPENQAADKIVRFIAWVGATKRALKDDKKATVIQSAVRMRLTLTRFRSWKNTQKRALVVAVRSATDLPMGDPIGRRCDPYVVISVVEPTSDANCSQVQTFSLQLPTKQGDAETTPRPSDKNGRRGGGNGGTKFGGGNGGKQTVGNPQTSFSWEEECLLPGVSDSATMVFTVMHLAPARMICLGQALVQPKDFQRIGEHKFTVELTKQNVPVWSSNNHDIDEPRVDNAEWTKPGHLCLVMRKASYCDSQCGEVEGPVAEEIHALALAESQGILRLGTASLRLSHSLSMDQHRRHPGLTITSSESASPIGSTIASMTMGGAGTSSAGGGDGAAGGIHQNLTWWVCIWLGRLRLYRHHGDVHPILNLCLDSWSLMPSEDDRKRTGLDLRICSNTSQRRLSLRCPSKVGLARWKGVWDRNRTDEVRRRHGIGPSRALHDSHPHHHQHQDDDHNSPKGERGSGEVIKGSNSVHTATEGGSPRS